VLIPNLGVRPTDLFPGQPDAKNAKAEGSGLKIRFGSAEQLGSMRLVDLDQMTSRLGVSRMSSSRRDEEKGRISCLMKVPGRRVSKVLGNTTGARLLLKLSAHDPMLNEMKIIFGEIRLRLVFGKAFRQINGLNNRRLQIFCHLPG
jgi:hypothetical protein